MEIKYKSNLAAGIVSIILGRFRSQKIIQQLMVSHQERFLVQSAFYGLYVVWFY